MLDYYRLHHVPFAVVLFDIDWFKKVNDTYGHDVGDEVLKELAQLISSVVRAEDKAYRIGGEEFVILFNRISKEDILTKMVDFKQLVENHPFVINDLILHITVSGGIYLPTGAKDENPSSLMKYVDEVLYEAKQSGRNQIILSKLNR